MSDVVVSNQSIQTSEAIPTQGVSQFLATATANDIILTFGHLRLIPRANSVDPKVEWLISLSMSPVTLKQLSEQLPVIVANYEKQNGTINYAPPTITTRTAG